MVGVNKQGKLNNTKQALKAAIKLAIPEGTISGDWRNDVGDMIRHLPFICVKIEENTMDKVHDRNIGGEVSGSTSLYDYTLHVFHSNCDETGYDKSKYVEDVCTRIEDYFISTPVGFDMDNWHARESDCGSRRVSRVIVTGQIHIQRID